MNIYLYIRNETDYEMKRPIDIHKGFGPFNAHAHRRSTLPAPVANATGRNLTAWS